MDQLWLMVNSNDLEFGLVESLLICLYITIFGWTDIPDIGISWINIERSGPGHLKDNLKSYRITICQLWPKCTQVLCSKHLYLGTQDLGHTPSSKVALLNQGKTTVRKLSDQTKQNENNPDKGISIPTKPEDPIKANTENKKGI